ncbi:4Fe-4S dicluster domain-containing protein [Aquisalimonas sp.]|uniref:4Fe-4S dicluster domain-containing protein n=1 Tax=Aquisalimonas sp. TaxID=1872621 RepID=UPI0025BEA1AD|nr:4Fe-4S dicluster domain-containing protein [Aquisalimonas sp.]
MSTPAILDRKDFDSLLGALRDRGHEVIGPRVRDGAIVYDTVDTAADLPEGWTDEHEGGHYRLKPRTDKALFGYVVGPTSWKKFLFPPQQTVFRATRVDGQLRFEPGVVDDHPRAFLGVRSCELHALAIQDKVFMAGPYADTTYQQRRESVFIIAVNCVEAGATCFCVSMDTGPAVGAGHDLALTEVINAREHYFLVEAGSNRGAELLAAVPHRGATEQEINAARGGVAQAAESMGRKLETEDIRALLLGNLDHPHWDEVADRCLSCANCTLVCPTCFCSSVEDSTSLDGGEAEHTRHWDSCFNQDFSYIAGGSVRASTASRYRQWLTHKLATWYDQFDSSGCVGCGSCITWCPVGIDITAEVAAIRASDQRRGDR